MDALFLALGVGSLVGFSLSLARDLPWRVARSILWYFPIPALLVIALTAGFGGLDAAAGIALCFFLLTGSFLLVTGGHVIRMISEERLFVTIPDDVRAKYMQHVTRYQLAGSALVLGLFALVYIV